MENKHALLKVSVPLRGLGSWKGGSSSQLWQRLAVSVPLRGLGSWKVEKSRVKELTAVVSVPLRGLGSWKERLFYRPKSEPRPYCFSPLAGIRFVES
jgi:hypothetical protein